MEELEKFNDYLIQVATRFKDVRIRRKMIELQRIIDHYKKREGIGEFEVGDVLDDYSTDEIMSYVKDNYDVDDIISGLDKDEIMKELGNSKMVEYLSDDYFIADDEDDAVEILTDGGYLDTELDCVGNSYSNLRRDDCMKLIASIVKREGWGYLYNQLEVEKEKLHLV